MAGDMTYLSLKLGLRKAEDAYLKLMGVTWREYLDMEKEALPSIENQEIDGYRIEVEERETYAYTVVKDLEGIPVRGPNYEIVQRMPLGKVRSIHIHKVREQQTGGKDGTQRIR